MYRSRLEERLGKGVLKNLEYETLSLPYTQEKFYKPDFINKDKGILFEAKGYFRTSQEAAKYVAFASQHPEWTLVFIFSDPNKPLPWAKKRTTDGKRMSHGEWADKNGFKFCTEHSVRKDWL